MTLSVLLPRGRIAIEKRLQILEYIGKEAKRRYLANLSMTGYKGDHFKNAFNWAPDPIEFENQYWLETGNPELDRILTWLEYGTGLYGPSRRMIQSSRISDKTGEKLLLKFNIDGQWFYKRKVRGVKPGFMFTKAVESVRNERAELQRNARLRLRI